MAALGDGVKGGKWFSLMDKVYARRTLEAAWKRVAANRGAAGVDRVSVERFKAREGHYLEELEAALREGRYRPDPVRRVHIPKGSGETRPLGIPTVKDRIVQTALKMVLEPIFEREFLPVSYGFRPGRGCKDALREVDALLKAGYTFVVDADVKSYFDTIPCGPLMDRLEDEISDGKVLALVEAFLGQDILDGLRVREKTVASEGRSRSAGAQEPECMLKYMRIPSTAGMRDPERSRFFHKLSGAGRPRWAHPKEP